jgi:hypothetical protein
MAAGVHPPGIMCFAVAHPPRSQHLPCGRRGKSSMRATRTACSATRGMITTEIVIKITDLHMTSPGSARIAQNSP